MYATLPTDVHNMIDGGGFSSTVVVVLVVCPSLSYEVHLFIFPGMLFEK